MNKSGISTGSLKLIFLIFVLILLAGSGCASDRKVSEIIKRSNTSCDLSHLGKNKLYYSSKYQRHLLNNVKKINRNNLR